jgi:hypothetical protein
MRTLTIALLSAIIGCGCRSDHKDNYTTLREPAQSTDSKAPPLRPIDKDVAVDFPRAFEESKGIPRFVAGLSPT